MDAFKRCWQVNYVNCAIHYIKLHALYVTPSPRFNLGDIPGEAITEHSFFVITAKILPVVRKQHLLLCTLLICNAAAMEVILLLQQ